MAGDIIERAKPALGSGGRIMMTTVGIGSQAFTGFFGCAVSSDVITLDSVRCARLTGSAAGARLSLFGFTGAIQGATPPPGS